MNVSNLNENGMRSAGYAKIIQQLGLQVIPNWHESMIASKGTHRIEVVGDAVQEIYGPRYWPGDRLGDHLEFALKYDGVNLAILASIFHAVDVAEIEAYVKAKPTGKYARRIWYLYELITGKLLSLDDLKRGNVVDLLEPKLYVTSSEAKSIRRQRIHDNLLGNGRFCPMVRRTETIERFLETNIRERCRQAVSSFPKDLLRRALNYLYTKETKSSFEIEQITPSASRTERFIALLELAEQEDFGNKARLVDLQNRIVDPRFANTDYRTIQNYIGQSVAWQREQVHFACPKPEDLPELMAGLLASHQRMGQDSVDPVVHAAVIAYGFVFLHPFDDGNGRIHRFLIHNILARRGMTPEGLMFPVSAVMLKSPADYDASLEAFSKPLMPLVEYELDETGQMTVQNDTAIWYRFIEMTAQVEALFIFIENTIDTELVGELTFLVSYDRARSALREIVDMPDRQMDLFIRFCLQNDGRLSSQKRTSHFSFLTDEEISQMEQAVQAAYGKT
ncbi:MAG: Fic family protein [Planctomycetia bacterium]|jgi:hypothetical protein